MNGLCCRFEITCLFGLNLWLVVHVLAMLYAALLAKDRLATIALCRRHDWHTQIAALREILGLAMVLGRDIGLKSYFLKTREVHPDMRVGVCHPKRRPELTMTLHVRHYMASF